MTLLMSPRICFPSLTGSPPQNLFDSDDDDDAFWNPDELMY